jgi:serine phosphatase RsbU (regulator of sigma subunit)
MNLDSEVGHALAAPAAGQSLPCAASPHDGDGKPKHAPPIGSNDILNAKILVVDDQEVNVRLLEGMLRIAGYTSVESTTDPNQVCELHRRNRYCLILLDLQMPGMDGFQVMEGLKEIEGDDYLPVIVITAQPGHKLRALEAGAKDFVGKPFDMAELRARVHNILEVRLLHLASQNHSKALEETVRELEASREVIRVKSLDEQKRREQELALAQETQESLLPRSLPEFENFHIHAFSHPTRYVGGDFYDFLQLSSGEWTGVLADVSGKGMSAALLSSMVLGALSMKLRSGTEPDEVLNRINQLICEKSLPFQFVTLFLFLLSPNGAGKFISAGHNPACLFRSATGKIEQLVSEHFFLGMFSFASYQSRPLQLCKGDTLVVYSDGLTEAENQQGEMFGEERLLSIVRQEAPLGSQALNQEILKAIDEFTQGVPQTDDITLVVVEKYA